MKIFLLVLSLMVSFSIPGGENQVMIKLVDGNTAFALDIYHHLSRDPGNIFLSPYSISTALAMTYAGAKGKTAEEMAKVLHFPQDQAEFHPAFHELQTHFRSIQKSGSVQLAINNALWVQAGYRLLEAFTSMNQKFYGANLFSLDFARDQEGSRLKINGWVEEKTSGKIKDLLSPLDVQALTRLILTNTIYFLGEWEEQFDPESTSDQDFHVNAGKKTRVPMMCAERYFGYWPGASLQVLEIPYKGRELSMLIILPEEIDGLAALESQLDPQTLKKWTSRLIPRKVEVYLPRFKTTGSFALKEILLALGMKAAFAPYPVADFSGIEPKQELHIDEVIHKTFIDLDEAGTEAAAATAVVMKVGAAPQKEAVPVFKADHPFLYLIRDRKTGSILFLGRLVDPGK